MDCGSTKNYLRMKNGSLANQLVFGRNPTLPNLMGENNHSSLERGGEEDYLRGILNVIHKTMVSQIHQESEDKL